MEETQTLLLSVRGEVEMFVLGIPTSGGMAARKDVGLPLPKPGESRGFMEEAIFKAVRVCRVSW